MSSLAIKDFCFMIFVMSIEIIKKELADMRDFFTRVVKIIPPFDIVDSHILPYGLKPHTRSIRRIENGE